MLSEYIEEAMRRAKYELMENGEFWGEIPGFQGVWASESSLEATRNELKSVLEDWLLVKLWDNDDDIPVLKKMSLVPKYARPKERQPRNEPGLPQRTRKAS